MSEILGRTPSKVVVQGSLTTTEDRTREIRFKMKDGKRILQAQYHVVVRENGAYFKDHFEWRDVECVDENTPDVEGLNGRAGAEEDALLHGSPAERRQRSSSRLWQVREQGMRDVRAHPAATEIRKEAPDRQQARLQEQEE